MSRDLDSRPPESPEPSGQPDPWVMPGRMRETRAVEVIAGLLRNYERHPEFMAALRDTYSEYRHILRFARGLSLQLDRSYAAWYEEQVQARRRMAFSLGYHPTMQSWDAVCACEMSPRPTRHLQDY